ncbi:hypothetical protein BU24DRAFT_424270 [Aaosphaeria arxii CBS 175.79]|uniref:CoA-dependent acyltransferase n=1 Tax=Aaosphaeria arxii CBS 175.79 TaxID=1450172 RepID=A0A6A5XJ19_9PLEO|nr:uncharacterized protein BU24DRAFT_424270 [Aaosphaeria arxii CBS 175.79]KAF2013268.1 hypothetical protein BU24DRAFT_424270 [Aaosphaeria arxii CBS 175.79]
MTNNEQDLGQAHWLSKYASNYHAWHTATLDGRKVYSRPIGLVESSFDADGTDFGGRADMNALFTLQIRHDLSQEQFRHRIALAWANLRLQHVMLQSWVHENEQSGHRKFVVGLHDSIDDVLEETLKSIVWVEDVYETVDDAELYKHCLNVGRIVDPSKCLSRLHVLPLTRLPNGNYKLRFLIIIAHQTSDGLSAYNWFSNFIRILNLPAEAIKQEIESFRYPESIASRLPPAQEDLYPPVAGNKARQRWFWAIMRILRYISKGTPPQMVNPLRREQRLSKAVEFPPTFDQLFDYSEGRRPPMNSGHVNAVLSKEASIRLIDLCRSIKVSVGAGCFALAGISMMEIHEQRYPDIADSERKPFVASFPLNPRAFFGFTTPADSCMLAFSEGITMPFLSSSLPFEGRFRLIAKHANRELRVYQKRLKSAGKGSCFDSHSPSRLLATGYIAAIERFEDKLAPHRKTGINPQGQYKPTGLVGATCGVSSVGSTASYFKSGVHDLDDVGRVKGKDFGADYLNLRMGVRARDNEFLVGSSTDYDGIVGFGVSYDASAISEEAANGWAEKISSLFEVGRASKL